MPSIAYYDSIIDPIRTARADRNGKQPCDPAKAGRGDWESVSMSTNFA